jgi:hypothetical protein
MVSSRPGQRFTMEEGSVALHGLIEKKLFSKFGESNNNSIIVNYKLSYRYTKDPLLSLMSCKFVCECAQIKG